MHRRSRIKRIRSKRNPLFLIILILAFVLGMVMITKGVKYLPVIFDIAFKKGITLKKTDGRVNVLLLGIGGGKHDGPNLTDTIILASIDPNAKKVTLISVPRDIWIPELKAKINTAYAFGEEKRNGGGLILTKAIVGKILNQEVNYSIRVDFSGFVKAVDMIGGIDITVDHVLDDPEYPLSGKEEDTCGFEGDDFEKRATDSSQLDAFPCRYEHLYFDEGLHHMTGEEALRFVRSRHAKGSEGTDFARSKRQEKVIQAFKDKVFSAGTLLNPIKLVSLVDIFKESIDADIKQSEYSDFVRLAEEVKNGTTQSVVLDYGDNETKRYGLLENPPISNEYKLQWVLIPRTGASDYSEIQMYIKCMIEKGDCEIGETEILTPTPPPN